MIIGHKRQQKILKALTEKENIPHAFLFSGPEKVGKRTVAIWFLKMINCESKDSPCLNCKVCRDIEEERHPDVMFIAPEKKEIQIGQIQEMIEKVYLKGVNSKFKGVVIDKAHLMSVQSQNTLLKTLEEPPSKTIIILVSDYPQMIIPTISSRVFEIKFSLVSEQEIKDELKNEEASVLSMGRPGLAVDYINNPGEKEKMKEIETELRSVLGSEVASRFALIKKVSKEEKINIFLESFLKVMREKMINSMSSKDENNYKEVIKEIEEVVFLYKKTNINIELAIEKIIIKI